MNLQPLESERNNQTDSPVVIEKNISQIMSNNIIPSKIIQSIGDEKKRQQFLDLRQIEFFRSNDSKDSNLQSPPNTNLSKNVTNNPQFQFNVTNWPTIGYNQTTYFENQGNFDKNYSTPKLQLTKVMNPAQLTSYNNADTGPQIVFEIPSQKDRINNSTYFSITNMVPQGYYLLDVLIDYSGNYGTPYFATYTGKILVTTDLVESPSENNQDMGRVLAEGASNSNRDSDPDNGREGDSDPDNGREGDSDPDNGREGDSDPDNGREGDSDDCLFDPSLPQCAPSEEGCPEDTFTNEDGQCIPNTECPDGFHTLDDDESGKCVPEDESSDADSSETAALGELMRAFN